MKQGTRKILVSFLLILAMLSGMIPGAAMAEELVFEEALPEQTEAVPAECRFMLCDAAVRRPFFCWYPGAGTEDFPREGSG